MVRSSGLCGLSLVAVMGAKGSGASAHTRRSSLSEELFSRASAGYGVPEGLLLAMGYAIRRRGNVR